MLFPLRVESRLFSENSFRSGAAFLQTNDVNVKVPGSLCRRHVDQLDQFESVENRGKLKQLF